MHWLIGVEHSEKNLDQVLNRLAQEEISNKKVMLEIYSYPVDNIIRDMNPSFTNFWEGIAKHILDWNGSIVFGEDKSLYFKALQRGEELSKIINEERLKSYKKLKEMKEKSLRMDCGWEMKEWVEEDKKIEEQVEKLVCEHDESPLIERDPHFMQVLAKEKPDIVILGYKHMPYLLKNCFPENNYSLTYIPSSVLYPLIQGEK
ncbi:hypothetical protein JW756_02350 [Candidatus Woesearchaeota archaeon]|nr:hypothetical protein [Candidatus Woesearchaeota archaeon]